MVMSFSLLNKPISHAVIIYDGDLYHFLLQGGKVIDICDVSREGMNITQNLPKFQSFSAIRIIEDLHICSIDVDNHLQHCIRKSDGKWARWENVCKDGIKMVDEYKFNEVTVNYTSQRLHVCAIREDNTLLHSIRNSNVEWTDWGDICKDCEELKDTKKKLSQKISKKISKIMSDKISKKLKFRDLQEY
jgi:hypothetical protein